jgi:hypothetical protein
VPAASQAAPVAPDRHGRSLWPHCCSWPRPATR